jgi:ClpP class serine protease
MNEQRFAPHGPLAVAPRAFGLSFALSGPPANEQRGGVSIVGIRGPLVNRIDPFFDSYEAIKSRIAAAMEDTPRGVVLSLDSPGGVVAGMFEAVREIRDMAAKANVPLYAFVENQATSAAFALACACGFIAMPAAASVGSIGVIDALIDTTDAQKAAGIRIQLIKSGNRKTDGSGSPTDDAIVATKGRVNAVAEIFFNLVAASRGLPVEEVRALDADTFVGAEAVGRKLADQVMTLDELLAAVAVGTVETPKGETTMKATKGYEDAIAALRKCAEGDDEEAAKARKMLKAELAEDDAPAKEPDGDEAKKAEGDEDKKESSKAEDAPAPEEKKDDKDEAKAMAVAARLDRLEAAQLASDRAALLATRPDLEPEMRKVLASASLDVVRDAVKTLPKRAIVKPAAEAMATGTRGEGQGDQGSVGRLPPAEKLALDVAMGLVASAPTVEHDGTKLKLGVYAPVKDGAR